MLSQSESVVILTHKAYWLLNKTYIASGQ